MAPKRRRPKVDILQNLGKLKPPYSTQGLKFVPAEYIETLPPMSLFQISPKDRKLYHPVSPDTPSSFENPEMTPNYDSPVGGMPHLPDDFYASPQPTDAELEAAYARLLADMDAADPVRLEEYSGYNRRNPKRPIEAVVASDDEEEQEESKEDLTPPPGYPLLPVVPVVQTGTDNTSAVADSLALAKRHWAKRLKVATEGRDLARERLGMTMEERYANVLPLMIPLVHPGGPPLPNDEFDMEYAQPDPSPLPFVPVPDGIPPVAAPGQFPWWLYPEYPRRRKSLYAFRSKMAYYRRRGFRRYRRSGYRKRGGMRLPFGVGSYARGIARGLRSSQKRPRLYRRKLTMFF